MPRSQAENFLEEMKKVRTHAGGELRSVDEGDIDRSGSGDGDGHGLASLPPPRGLHGHAAVRGGPWARGENR